MRVIAGTLRGRRLAAPPPGVRPTADRVRESLFARLGDVEGARVLDLFAGTGALGIEAISRGAEHVVFVDRSSRAISALEKNLATLEIVDRATVRRSEALGAIGRLSADDERFHLVLVDPPYDDFDLLGPLLARLVEQRILADGATVVVECSKRHAVPPTPGLTVESARHYGDTTVTWLVATTDRDASPGVRQR